MVNVIIAGKYDIAELVDQITLDDNLDEIAYRATIKAEKGTDFPKIEAAVSVVIKDEEGTLLDGVIWDYIDCETGVKSQDLTVYDRTIYLAKSEDEYMFSSGQMATQRIIQYAKDWGIELGPISGTDVLLAKAIYRAQSIYSMIKADLKETVDKGGGMYRPRMSGLKLELVPLGSNNKIPLLQTGVNIEDQSRKGSMEGVATIAKVLGNAEEDQRSPVLARVEGETSTLGGLQKIISDSKITNGNEAKTAGQKALSGIQETFSVRTQDVRWLRAGDKVKFNDNELIATSVRHELGTPGHMVLELATADVIRRRYYGSI